MARYGRLLTDAQWEKIRPLLPHRPPRPRGGRPPSPDRKVLEGILWILRSGARWQDLPEEFPSPATCWRRWVTCSRPTTGGRSPSAPPRSAWPATSGSSTVSRPSRSPDEHAAMNASATRRCSSDSTAYRAASPPAIRRRALTAAPVRLRTLRAARRTPSDGPRRPARSRSPACASPRPGSGR